MGQTNNLGTRSRVAPGVAAIVASLGLLAVGMDRAVQAQPADHPDPAAFLASLSVPDDCSLEWAAGAPAVRFPMFGCFDDRGRLYVAESSGNDLYEGLQKLTRDCRIVRLEDGDDDGRFESSAVFQAGVTFPMGLAWRAGKLYVADPPDLIALTDADDDGRADRREVVLTGFGHTDNGSLHGLTFGPDGMLYFTMGEPDGWKLKRQDGSILEGTAGALFRAPADGSDVEVISRGFVNLVEVEFLPSGEAVGTDNWFQLPVGGWRDALVDCAPDGLFPYARNRGTPLPWTGWTLPPLILLPAVAHSGIARPRADTGPPEWRESVFVAEHNTRRVVRHRLRRQGATFRSEPQDFVTGRHPDFHPSDVLEDADGSWLIVDTGGWYVEHCPTGRIRNSRAPGGIYRARWKKAPQVADPWGRLIRWDQASVRDRAARLRDPRDGVAERAAHELARRSETAELVGALSIHETLATRLRALWALAGMQASEAATALRAQLSAADPVVVAAAARAIAHRRDSQASDRLVALLDAGEPFVRRAAAEALARCGSARHAPALAAALARAEDAFEQHAGAAALLELADETFARSLLTQASPNVRLAALACLDQPRLAALQLSDLLGPLNDEDPFLSAGAAALLERHPEWASAAVAWLRERLSRPPGGAERERTLEVLWARFQSEPAVRALLTEHLSLGDALPMEQRRFLLRLLPQLTSPPETTWGAAIAAGLTQPAVRREALQAAAAFPRPEWEPLLKAIAEDEQAPAAERLLAAKISRRIPVLSEPVFALALALTEPESSPLDRLAATELLARAQLSPDQLRQTLKALGRGDAITVEMILPTLRRSSDRATRPEIAALLLERLKADWSPSRPTMTEVLGLFSDDPATRQRIDEAWQSQRRDSLARLQEFLPLLSGGDAERGREVFALAACLGCHRVGTEGGTAGPDLTKIGAIRSGEDLVESILYPSNAFAQGYESYVAVRLNGDEVGGTLVERDSDTVQLRDGAGVLHRIRRNDLRSLDRITLSAMPEGLEQLMTRDQFRDLLAYLQSLR